MMPKRVHRDIGIKLEATFGAEVTCAPAATAVVVIDSI
jgi:hypothetical protein